MRILLIWYIQMTRILLWRQWGIIFRAKNKKYEVEYRLKQKNGDYRWFRDVGSITEEDEDYKMVTGVVIDVDDRKRAEKGEE